MSLAKPKDHLLSVISDPWALLLKLDSFSAKRDRYNQPGKAVQ